MNAQIIKHNGQPAFAVIPFSEWESILDRIEEMADGEAIEAAKGEESFPIEFADRLLRNEPPVKVWREYRGLTLQALAERCGVTRQMLSILKNGKTRPSAALLGKLAAALRCDMDDLHQG